MLRIASLPLQSCFGDIVPLCRRCAAALAVVPLALGSLSASAATRFDVNTAQSSVHFSLSDTLHSFGGAFQISLANFVFDRGTRQMSGRIVVSAATGNSGSEARDRKMKKEELKVKVYPDIDFEPSSYTGQIPASGTSTIQVSGSFTLLGQPHPLTVPMTITVSGNQCTASGTFEIPYVNWGLRNPSVFMIHVQKQVKIDLKLVGRLAPAD